MFGLGYSSKGIFPSKSFRPFSFLGLHVSSSLRMVSDGMGLCELEYISI